MGGWDLLRWATVAVAAAASAFWLYAIYYLIANASPTGDGMELVAIVPLSVVLGALTLPALILAWKGRRIAIAAGLAAVSLVANYFLWGAILSDLA